MKITVRLFGLLSRKHLGDDEEMGRVVSLRDGAKVSDLLELIGVSSEGGVCVIADAFVLKEGQELEEGSTVYIFDAVSGG